MSVTQPETSGASQPPIDVVLGGQWGDEGKGKLADVLSKRYDVIARFNGGNNAGHTVVADGIKYAFHLLPCGVVHPHTTNLIGHGVVLNMEALFSEIETFEAASGRNVGVRLFISDRTQLLFRMHQTLDRAQETDRAGSAIGDRKSTRLNSSHTIQSRMPSSA